MTLVSKNLTGAAHNTVQWYGPNLIGDVVAQYETITTEGLPSWWARSAMFNTMLLNEDYYIDIYIKVNAGPSNALFIANNQENINNSVQLVLNIESYTPLSKSGDYLIMTNAGQQKTMDNL